MFNWYKKEKPILSLLGFGGGGTGTALIGGIAIPPPGEPGERLYFTALDTNQFIGTFNNINTDDTNYIRAASSHIDFDPGQIVNVTGLTITAKWTSYVDDGNSADYRIQTSDDSNFSTILESSITLESENTTDVKTLNFAPTQNFRYLRFGYNGGGRVARLRFLSLSY